MPTWYRDPAAVAFVLSIEAAEEMAQEKLADPLPRRWRHVRSVVRRARWVAGKVSLSDELVAAAWLRDIGYAPELMETGFHPLDGARSLRGAGVNGQVVSLVAYHSCAEIDEVPGSCRGRSLLKGGAQAIASATRRRGLRGEGG